MKRILTVLFLLLCCAGLCLPVLADSSISTLSSDTSVLTDGSCTVVISADLLLEEAAGSLVFPVPEEAENVTLNGEGASRDENGHVRLNSITGGGVGQFHFTVRYSLPPVVNIEQEQMRIELPLLCGFSYPIENLRFTLTLPGEITQQPVFTSSYYQENIHSQLELSVTGSTITGSIQKLKDHDSLWMRMDVDETMFPQTAATARALSKMDLFTGIGIALALAYYLITMVSRPPKRVSRATAPDGICAGDLALWLTGQGIDLSLMVVTWAQLGYLRIQVDDNGRVLLHKRMDMGNERSSFENQYFKLLFGRRRIVDGTGYHYAALCRSLRGKTPRIREIYRRRTGNPKVFRALCIIPALISGITLGAGFSTHSLFLQVLLAIIAGIFALVLQSGGACVPVRRKLPLYLSLVCAGVWILLGILSAEAATACLMVVLQFLAGVGIAYGGKRTELGQQALEQILGLRRHMRKVSKKELQQILKQNPSYFYQLAPYALAMDRDRVFARRFARLRLSECTYLVSGMRGQMTAAEWAKLLRTTVQTLDQRADRLPLERLTGR